MQHYGWPVVHLDKPWDAEELRPLMLHTWSNGPPPDAGPDWVKGYYEYDIPLRPFLDFRCPNGTSETHSDGQPFATYVGMGGVGEDAPTLPSDARRAGVWAYDRQTRITDLLDGTADTILLIETAHENGCWVAGGNATVRGVANKLSVTPYVRGVGEIAQFGGLHPGGGLAAFVDGHVDFVSEFTERSVFEALCTAWGQELADERRDAGVRQPDLTSAIPVAIIRRVAATLR